MASSLSALRHSGCQGLHGSFPRPYALGLCNAANSPSCSGRDGLFPAGPQLQQKPVLCRPWSLGRPQGLPHRPTARPVVAMANIFTDAWGTNSAEELQTLAQAAAAQLFAFSIFPYAAFLYYLTKSKAAPPLMLFGWYFLLAFVGASIPAGIYAKNVYGTTLANVDWLHGGAEMLLTFTNLFIVLGTRQAIRKIQEEQQQAAAGGATHAQQQQRQQQTVPADE